MGGVGIRGRSRPNSPRSPAGSEHMVPNLVPNGCGLPGHPRRRSESHAASAWIGRSFLLLRGGGRGRKSEHAELSREAVKTAFCSGSHSLSYSPSSGRGSFHFPSDGGPRTPRTRESSRWRFRFFSGAHECPPPHSEGPSTGSPPPKAGSSCLWRSASALASGRRRAGGLGERPAEVGGPVNAGRGSTHEACGSPSLMPPVPSGVKGTQPPSAPSADRPRGAVG